MNNGKVKIVDKLRWRKDYDAVTVYNFETDDLFRLPPIALDILENANGDYEIEEITEIVINNNNLKRSEELIEKINNYIESLVSKKILNNY
jgi:hypothetical protein